MAELKPCPFCGKPVNIVYNSFENVHKAYHTNGWDDLECPIQEPIIIDVENRNDAIEAWNRRVNNAAD